jgi:hypothetical protein
MEATVSPDKQIVGANGIPRRCMSFPQGSPLLGAVLIKHFRKKYSKIKI